MLYVIGDVHGQMEKLVALLLGAGLVDGELHWTGGDAKLLLVGTSSTGERTVSGWWSF
ncbi:MAG: hypothetical protein M3Q29_05000 [Chloroflexota bacterium]|nr:hypothetical protein [Chloroflexota bacterium]